MKQNENYDASSISVLKGLDAVRKRPGMYIGDTDDGSGLHHMVFEIVDNAVDEVQAGYANQCLVTINKDNSVTVEDNGRGIPVDIHKEEGISAAEVVLTRLHAGGKFNQNSYKVSGGLHGVGAAVVNALSEWMKVTIWRNNREYQIEFENGVTTSPLTEIKTVKNRTGTKVTFKPSPDIFTHTVFDLDRLKTKLQELAFLNSGMFVSITDRRVDENNHFTFHYEGGLNEFVKHLSKSKIWIAPVINGRRKDDVANISVEFSLVWTDSYTETILCFTNNIPQKDGGTHLAGFRQALTRVVSKYTEQTLNRKSSSGVTGDDIREGLVAVLSVKVPDPKFSSQTKDKLVSSEVQGIVTQAVSDVLSDWLELHPEQTKEIVNKVMNAVYARNAARKARELTRTKNKIDIASLPGKLADCQERNPSKAEIFIVEGDSAGGTAKQGRDRGFQAILPLKGKILNVEKARLDRVLNSAEVGTLITALGTGIGRGSDINGRFSLSKLRYHKIIIMTDADVDGSHIRTLLLTFFYRQMPELIENGYVYIAQPPLYKITYGKHERYLKNETELEAYLLSRSCMGNRLILGNKEELGDDKLISYINTYKNMITRLKSLEHYAPAYLMEQIILSHGFDHDIDYVKFAKQLNTRLNDVFSHISNNWSVSVDDMGIFVSKSNRNVDDQYRIPMSFIHSSLGEFLSRYSDGMSEEFTSPACFIVGKNESVIYGPSQLYSLLISMSKKGISVSRFKGLGEMNDDQLWHTTLDPATRTLLQVKIGDIHNANRVFSMLMGDDVKPRKNFITTNSHTLVNLDI